MKTEQEYLDQLTYDAEVNLKKAKLPYCFHVRLNKDPTRKFQGNIIDYLNAFGNYNITEINSLNVKLLINDSFELKTEVDIEFYEPCWRIECLYHIYNDTIESWASYYCYLDEYTELEKAFKNVEFVIKYFKLEIEENFIKWKLKIH